MLSTLEKYLTQFQDFSNKTKIGNCEVDILLENAFVLRPENATAQAKLRDIDLGILGLTHGNEVAGLPIICELLRQIDAGILKLDRCVGFFLGNTDAALEMKRFIDSDLNRSFGLKSPKNKEEKRAQDLSKIFQRTNCLIDLHQTQGATSSPFFISTFEKKSFQLFRMALPQCPIVTYWDSQFSDSGMTTLNFHIKEQGYGFGIELGEKGFDAYQIEFGTSLILKVINILTQDLLTKKSNTQQENLFQDVYTFDHIIKSVSGSFELLAGWTNMSRIFKNQEIGMIDGKKIFSPIDGRVLFPKYPTAQEKVQPNLEVFRILKPISKEELNKHLI